MNTWSPLFSKIVDSSLWHESDQVVKIFLTMLAKKDADHVVRANAYNIGQWARKTESEVLEALKILSSPDTGRIEPQPFEGRRIAKVDDGWLILNGQAYENLMRQANRRAYKTAWQRDKRAAGKLLPGENTVTRLDDSGASRESVDRATDLSVKTQPGAQTP